VIHGPVGSRAARNVRNGPASLRWALVTRAGRSTRWSERADTAYTDFAHRAGNAAGAAVIGTGLEIGAAAAANLTLGAAGPLGFADGAAPLAQASVAAGSVTPGAAGAAVAVDETLAVEL
jgi:hypothetical protein